ncbi:hypothetical protein ACHQM5_019582 [Ranunculus cassubicifolius]
MFTSLSLPKIVLHNTNLLSSLEFLSLIRFISTDSITTHNKSFTISYLINSCGLSQQKAVSASKKVHFDSSTNPDSVLNLLKNNGFSDSDISRIIATLPKLLVSSVDKTLKPKFDFFNSKGLSGADLAKFVTRKAYVLNYSLENTIIPTFDFLESIVGTDANVIAMLKRSLDVLRYVPEKTFTPNFDVLYAHGVPHSNVVKLLVSQPRVFFRNPSRFSENVEEVKKMKFNPSQYMFLVALHVLNAMSRSSLEAKFDVYRGWGWSEDEVQHAFRVSPHCMMLSKENIMSTMDTFVNKFGYSSSLIAKQPSLLHLSCERRIIPRCSVIQGLIKNGQITEAPSLRTVLTISDDKFLKYISKFGKEVPELFRAYQEGKMNG